jgi:hypothetical protein
MYTPKVHREQGLSQVYFKSIQREGFAVYTLQKYTENNVFYRYTLKVHREQGLSQVYSESTQRTGSFTGIL